MFYSTSKLSWRSVTRDWRLPLCKRSRGCESPMDHVWVLRWGWISSHWWPPFGRRGNMITCQPYPYVDPMHLLMANLGLDQSQIHILKMALNHVKKLGWSGGDNFGVYSIWGSGRILIMVTLPIKDSPKNKYRRTFRRPSSSVAMFPCHSFFSSLNTNMPRQVKPLSEL